ncbi:unnamed protein product [Acanthoscelides obtectus]|uniref:Uncharacterized protein n=1 Tax=Acanthoscelides obtectus TaxID=200917 RepID=A0A9P0Q031_ACAOB|nr:unnamed protein product [Acanthoscelides obtectus]CAK1678422.1 hypothetical protein AOBTE_LOCUS31893 [Acanthoscelides obtectus]
MEIKQHVLNDFCFSKYPPRRLIHICMRSNQFLKHLFHSFSCRSKTAFFNASTASSGDWNL